MNVADQVVFGDILEMKGTAEEKLAELVSRLDSYRVNLVTQLRGEPTLFYADPDNEPEKVSGSKPGDLAIWVDDTGTQKYRILGV